MSEWKNWMEEIDDDYLIGIANKGIVKRAYKDKEEGITEILEVEKEVKVKVGGETVTICYPLSESKCSCPSRSICRHVILAILVFRETLQKDKKENVQKKEEENIQIKSDTDKTEELIKNQKQIKENNTDKTADRQQEKEADLYKTDEQQENETSLYKINEQQTEDEQQETKRKKKGEGLLEEICQYPLQRLKKIMGVRQFQNFVSQVKSKTKPEIQYSSVITIKMQQNITVKLLYPLEYSSCTCHKKEFCVHKASAVLWCQLEANVLTEEILTKEAAKEMAYDLEQIQKEAKQMKAFLEELLGTGLSRTSPDVLDYLERFAIISHNANLPKYEGYFRALLDSYKKYLKRMASFQTRDFIGQITRLYRRVELLLQAKSNEEIAEHAGEFKSEYTAVGNLDLIGITMERFSSQTGYEGETIYFLEKNTKEWYTYTEARPVFYDNRRSYRRSEKGQAPWGILISLEELSEKRISLSRARCDSRNRLSSSQEIKGTITGERKLTWKELEGWYYQDFGKLFSEQIGQQRGQWLLGQKDWKDGVKLVLIQPDSCEKAEFSETNQQLSMVLFDKAGREVVVEMTYSKKEENSIWSLERIREKRLPCFLGKIYLRDGRIRMYPIALVDRREIRDEWV